VLWSVNKRHSLLTSQQAGKKRQFVWFQNQTNICIKFTITVNNNYYWMRLSKISWFVSGKQIDYLPKLNADTNNWSVTTQSQLREVICHLNYFTWELGSNYAWAEYYLQQTHLDGTTHEQTIICRQLFTGHLVGSRPVKRKKKMHRMIKRFIFQLSTTTFQSTQRPLRICLCAILQIRAQASRSCEQQLLNQDLEHFMINYVHVSIALSTYPSIHVLVGYSVNG